MLITTMNDVPGYEITDVYGEVFGLTVRSRNAFSQLGAGFKSMLGGELKGMTKALVDSRKEVTAADGRRGRGEGCQRDRRDALRHVGDGRHLDRDLRLRHRGRGSTSRSEALERRVVQRDAVAPERVAGREQTRRGATRASSSSVPQRAPAISSASCGASSESVRRRREHVRAPGDDVAARSGTTRRASTR